MDRHSVKFTRQSIYGEAGKAWRTFPVWGKLLAEQEATTEDMTEDEGAKEKAGRWVRWLNALDG